MEERKLICIGCPMGCPLTVVMNGKEVVSVTGNTCKRGDVYARKEVTDPTRIVTSTVRVSGGSIHMVSVKTKEDIPKDKIFECVRALKGIQVSAPVHIGDIILKNVADTGVDIVATKNVEGHINTPEFLFEIPGCLNNNYFLCVTGGRSQ